MQSLLKTLLHTNVLNDVTAAPQNSLSFESSKFMNFFDVSKHFGIFSDLTLFHKLKTRPNLGL